MPEISVWPVSGSVCTRKVGSSCASSLQGDAQLVLVGFGLGLDGHRDDRRGKLDGFENDGLIFIAKRVAGVDALQAHASRNIAGINFVNFFALVGMHLQQAADAFARDSCRSCST